MALWRFWQKAATPEPGQTHGLLQIATFDALVLPPFDAALLPLGLQRIGHRVWAMPGAADIRPMFALRAWKGAAHAPSWGVSLAMVPHVSGGKAAWHRTHKSAKMDVWEDAMPREMDLTLLASADEILRKLPGIVAGSVQQAVAFWDSTRQLADIPAALDRLRAKNPGLFRMQPQMSLADHIVSKNLGLHDRAETALAAWRQNRDAAEVAAVLERLGP